MADEPKWVRKRREECKSANSSRGKCYLQYLLKKVKVDLDLKVLSGNVSRIGRTQKRDLVFELK